MKTTTSEQNRHILLRAEQGEILPDALTNALRDEAVTAGWIRASGAVADVELRVLRGEVGGLGEIRRIAGPVQLVSLEGSIGIVDGDVSVGMRVVLARDTDRGIDALAGELTTARILALEAIVTALDDIAVERTLDRTGLWVLGAGSTSGEERAARAAPPKDERRQPVAPPAPPPAWNEAIVASAEAPPPRFAPPPRVSTANTQHTPSAVIPQRLARAAVVEEVDVVFPEAGDEVEHFAFGRCDVLKSDGDRLHLKVGKDGRIKEIALEMLRVHPLEPEGERRRFRLDRKL